MKPSELKKIIEPMVRDIVKSSVKEMMLESGLLTKIIAEVMTGMNTQKLNEQKLERKLIILESKIKELENKPAPFNKGGGNSFRAFNQNNKSDALSETKKKLVETIGKGGYAGLFDSITETIPDEVHAQPGNPMATIDPQDPGVNVEGLFDTEKMKKMVEMLDSNESRYQRKVIKG